MKLFYLILLTIIPFCRAAGQQQNLVSCGTNDNVLPEKVLAQMKLLPELVEKYRARTSTGEMTICRVAIEIDSDTYLAYEKDTAAIIEKAIDNIEKCSQLFEKEINCRLVITNIRIWKDNQPDPFRNQNDIFVLLSILGGSPPATTNFDKRIYLITKNVTGAGGVAYLNSAFNVSPLEYAPTEMHEMGHSFGSPHTHNCYWPGGPIDYCSSIEGDCYTKSMEQTIGTIMSYCGRGTSVFHPLTKALMQSHAETNFSKILAKPDHVQLLSNVMLKQGDFFSWPASLTAESYKISMASSANFSDEKVQDTPYNGIFTYNLPYGKESYVRIKAVNQFGNSDWSRVIKIAVNTSFPGVAQLLTPVQNQILPPSTPATFTFSKVEGATGYKIQLARFSDVQWQFPTEQFITTNTFTFSPDFMPYKWRVKAIAGANSGAWSEAGFFSSNISKNISLYLPLPENMEDVPLTFPFSYSAMAVPNAIVKIEIADNKNFTNPVFSKSYTVFQGFTDVVQNLPSNKSLFLRVQEINNNTDIYTERLVVDYTIPFKTGTKKLPPGLTFMAGLNQELFGLINSQTLAASKDYVWFDGIYGGFVRINPADFSYEIYNRENTDGLLGAGMSNSAIRSDKSQNIYFLNTGTSNAYRMIKLLGNDPKEGGQISTFNAYTNFQGFAPEKNLYWTSHELFQVKFGFLELVQRFDANTFIFNVKTVGNTAWMLIQDNTKGIPVLFTVNIDNPSITDQTHALTNSALDMYISQIETGGDGKVWVRQTDMYGNNSSIAMFDGKNWSRFSGSVLIPNGKITALAVSSTNDAYILINGEESRIYKSNEYNAGWEKAGVPVPLTNYGDQLWVDNNEDFWIGGKYGLARLSSCEPKAIISKTKDNILAGETITFKAENCSNGQLWSWTNTESSVNDSLVTTGSTLALTLLSTTKFTVKCQGKNCTANDTTFTIQVSPLVTGVNPNNKIPLVSVYPNPVTDKILIKLEGQNSGNYQFFLSDVKGNLINSIKTSQAVSEWDVSKLPVGLYTIWTVDDKQKFSWKLVKN